MYRTFIRTWWRVNKEWPRGLEPHAGRKSWCTTWSNEAQARQECQEYNSTHNPGRLSRKMEYTSV